MERFLLIEYIVSPHHNHSLVECPPKETSYHNSKAHCKLCFGSSCCSHKNAISWRGLNWRMAHSKSARHTEHFGKSSQVWIRAWRKPKHSLGVESALSMLGGDNESNHVWVGFMRALWWRPWEGQCFSSTRHFAFWEQDTLELGMRLSKAICLAREPTTASGLMFPHLLFASALPGTLLSSGSW